MLGYCTAYLTEVPNATAEELSLMLHHIFPEKPVVSRRTVQRRLEGALYTYKVLQHVPAGRNTSETKAKRATFVVTLSQLFLWDVFPVFVDECGFHLWTQPQRGRALRGERALVQVPSAPGKTLFGSVLLPWCSVRSPFG